MSTTQGNATQFQQVTPPSSFINDPLTPPSTNEKHFPGALSVLALFRKIKAGRHADEPSWVRFQLVPGEYEEIERVLKADAQLGGFVEDKIRYDYDEVRHRVFVRMPSSTHKVFLEQVKDAIWSQLKAIRGGTGKTARFAQDVASGRSSQLEYPAYGKSKNEPDAIYWHRKARYPGVIIEVAYSEKKKNLARLADNYILNSDATIQAVIGLDIEYGKKASRKATLSVWRPRLTNTADGLELSSVEEVSDAAFRDEDGNPTDHLGLRLRLSDFAYEALAQSDLGEENAELTISGVQLCNYLTEAEECVKRWKSLDETGLPLVVKKRPRSSSPPEELASEDEIKFAEQEARAAQRAAHDDDDYANA